MCRWMEVSRSGFYDWRNAPESATVKRRGILALYVEKSFDDSDGTYGYRRGPADPAARGGPAGPAPGPPGLPPPRSRPPPALPAAAVAVQPHRGRRPGAQHSRPGETGFHRWRTRPENGRRHYLRPDMAGLALSGDGHRLPYKRNNRLGNGR